MRAGLHVLEEGVDFDQTFAKPLRHASAQNLRIDRPLTRYPERGYDLMSTGDSGNGMLRQRTTNRPKRTA
jgi:hypothetical protein